MIRVFINPPANPVMPSIGGIDRVVEAQCKLLPEYGITITSDPTSADLIANHATLNEEQPGVPMVCHNHGLYWHDYDFPPWTESANRSIIDVMRRAQAVTAPSHWVANAISRGMLISPHVIYHGVDTDEWTPGESAGYVLWNKGREDSVSNPKDMQELARIMPGVPFVSTFGIPTTNVRISGPVSREMMGRLVQRAGIYLATARETFGIGTIEALACGVPVVGWDYGGQGEIINNDETGYLVPYGEYEILASAIREAIANRSRLSSNARSDALSRWTWASKISQYAELYNGVYNDFQVERPRVSVIVTAHNLSRFLSDCIESLRSQTMTDWECIVVDDYSEDGPKEVIDRIADPRVRYIRTRENVGLSNARNIGWMRSKGNHIIFLDADDMLDRASLEVLSDALDRDTGIHIAYGRLDTINEDGENRQQNPWPSNDFDWRAQMSHLNQLHYASLMRREVLERSGGYRERDWRAEDASMWCRVTSFGFVAKKVTDRSTMIYRLRGDSKSVLERNEHSDGDGDWTRWIPWRTGASNGKEGEEVFYKNIKPKSLLVPFGSQGKPPVGHASWPVHHHADPVVSIIIPVANNHRRYLVDAIDSCIAQTIVDWEVIVIDDSVDSSMPEILSWHPFARVFYSAGAGTSKARNIGLMHAHGKFILFLDADDVLEPTVIEEMLSAYTQYEGYIYSDCKIPDDPKRLDGSSEIIESLDYDQDTFIRCGYTKDMPGCHSVTTLIAKADLVDHPGFDETLAYWEDWKFYLDMARLGIRGTRIPKPLLTYRFNTGIRRRASRVQEGLLQEALRKEFEPYTTGEKQMCACGGGSGGSSAQAAAIRALRVTKNESVDTVAIGEISEYTHDGKVRLKYVGNRVAAVQYRGSVSRLKYAAGLDAPNDIIDVDARDAPELMRTNDFEIIDTARIAERMRKWN